MRIIAYMEYQMRSKTFILSCTFLLVLFCLSFAHEDTGFQFQKRRVSERILTLSTLTGNSRVVAKSTKKGLVMIDSLWAPGIAEEAKKIIFEEFGREDFVYLINTSGGDTLQGKPSFS